MPERYNHVGENDDSKNNKLCKWIWLITPNGKYAVNLIVAPICYERYPIAVDAIVGLFNASQFEIRPR